MTLDNQAHPSYQGMKVALITANVAVRYGGPAIAAKLYAKALSMAGVSVRLVTTNMDGSERLDVPIRRLIRTEDAYDVCYCRAGSTSKYRPWSPSFAAGIRDAIEWADIVHVNSLYLPHNLYAYIFCKEFQKPYVVRPHGTLERYQRLQHHLGKSLYDKVFGRRYLADAAAFHFASESEADVAHEVLGDRPSVVAGIPISIPEEPAQVAKQDVVLFLGRVTAKKRLDLLLDCWPSVRNSCPQAELVVAGPVDDDQRNLLDRMSHLPGVKWRGLVQGEERDEIFRSAGAFVLASQNENFGVALAEAMSWGLPVVTTEQVALARAVRASDAGIVLPHASSASLGMALVELLRDGGRRQRLGSAGRLLVAQQFSADALGKSLGEAMHCVVRTRSGRGSAPARARASTPGDGSDL